MLTYVWSNKMIRKLQILPAKRLDFVEKFKDIILIKEGQYEWLDHVDNDFNLNERHYIANDDKSNSGVWYEIEVNDKKDMITYYVEIDMDDKDLVSFLLANGNMCRLADPKIYEDRTLKLKGETKWM